MIATEFIRTESYSDLRRMDSFKNESISNSKFTVVRKIGEGVSSIIYLVRQLESLTSIFEEEKVPERLFALKVFYKDHYKPLALKEYRSF